MKRATYYMYPCDTCHMNSEKIRDKCLNVEMYLRGSLFKCFINFGNKIELY